MTELFDVCPDIRRIARKPDLHYGRAELQQASQVDIVRYSPSLHAARGAERREEPQESGTTHYYNTLVNTNMQRRKRWRKTPGSPLDRPLAWSTMI